MKPIKESHLTFSDDRGKTLNQLFNKMSVMILKVNPFRPEKKIIARAAEILGKGGLLIFPTETLYGLAADAFNRNAVKKIFRVKKRPQNRPLIILIENLNQLKTVARDIPKETYALAKRFWPGPLTLRLKRKKNISKELSGDTDTIAVRISSHSVAHALVKALGRPITATSANISGKTPHRTAQGVIRELGQKKEIKLILDAGRTPLAKPSTILDLTQRPFKILRQGSIKITKANSLLQ